MAVVILVPRRAGEEARDRAWGHCKRVLELQTGWPIFEADSEGIWNRSQAINRASTLAGDWEQAVVIDADTVHEPYMLLNAIYLLRNNPGSVVPWTVRWKLSESGTERFLARGVRGVPRHNRDDLDKQDGTPLRIHVLYRGGTIAVSRESWELVGGFDERFEGWGHEDVAFRVALNTLTPTRVREIRGSIWHLWHPRATPHQPNEILKRAYQGAMGNPSALREVMMG